MYGCLNGVLCGVCDYWWDVLFMMYKFDVCLFCGVLVIWFDVVWFGEIFYYMDKIVDVLSYVDVFVLIGILGEVYLVVNFVVEVDYFGVYIIELNLEFLVGVLCFVECCFGFVFEIVFVWVVEELV